MPNINEELATWHRADQVRAAEATRWLTMSEVHELTRLPVRTLKLYIDTGRLRAYRPQGGTAVRIKADDIAALFVQIQPKSAAGKAK